MSVPHPDVILNIELKVPKHEGMFKKYNHNLSAKKTIDLIDKYSIARKSIISSFDTRILDDVIRQTPDSRQFLV